MVLAQERMKKFADRHCRELEFQVGDFVYLKLRPYRQRTLAKKCCEKFSSKFFVPYPMLARVGTVAYCLELLSGCIIHLVFHVCQLKRAMGSNVHAQLHPPELSDDFEWLAYPERVLDKLWNAQAHPWELLIKWRNLPACEATWEGASGTATTTVCQIAP